MQAQSLKPNEQEQVDRYVSSTVAQQLGNLMLANIELQARVAVLEASRAAKKDDQ